MIETRTFHPVGDTASRQFQGADRRNESRPRCRHPQKAASVKISITVCARIRSPRRRCWSRSPDRATRWRAGAVPLAKGGRTGRRRAGARGDHGLTATSRRIMPGRETIASLEQCIRERADPPRLPPVTPARAGSGRRAVAGFPVRPVGPLKSYCGATASWSIAKQEATKNRAPLAADRRTVKSKVLTPAAACNGDRTPQ